MMALPSPIGVVGIFESSGSACTPSVQIAFKYGGLDHHCHMHGGHALERPARDVKEGALTTAAVLCAHARRAARETQRDIMAARDLVRTAGVCVAQAVSRGWD